jgi:hypothetical protein
MHSSFHHIAAKLLSAFLGVTLLLSLGPAALRTIAHVDLLLAQISLELCGIGVAVLRACGI